jgi:hypothetical protein
MRTVPCVLAAAIFFAGQDGALAQSKPSEGPALVYRSPEECPSGEGFMQRIRARLGVSRTASGDGRTLNVQIAPSGRGYSGRLSLIGPDGRSTTKSLEARDCEDLVDALALVAALAVESDDDAARAEAQDPEARRSRATTPTASSSPTPVAPAASPSATRGTPAAPPNETPRSTPVVVPTRLPVDRASEPTAGSGIGLELGGLVALGPAPTPVYGGALSFVWIAPGDGLFQPAFQLGAGAAFAPDLAEPSGKARFAWLTVRAAAYLLRWTLGGEIVVRAGAIGDVGVLLARGLETLSPASSSRGWLSLGVALSLDAPLGSRFTFRPVLGVEAPLRRDRYAFGSTDFFEVPAAIAAGSVSILAHF